jgi:hypothetical protein
MEFTIETGPMPANLLFIILFQKKISDTFSTRGRYNIEYNITENPPITPHLKKSIQPWFAKLPLI